MAIIYNQIGSLTELIGKLNYRGIDSINSLSDAISFKKNYNTNIDKIKLNKKIDLINLIVGLKKKLDQLSVDYDVSLKLEGEKLTNEKNKINDWLNKYNEKYKNLFFVVLNFYKHYKWQKRLKVLENNFREEQKRLCSKLALELSSVKFEIEDRESYPDKYVDELSKEEIDHLKEINIALEANKEFFYGALGEDSALAVLKNLPDSYKVINDFHLFFKRPVYDKKNNDRIYSVQIDHLVVGPAGLFIVETKNWSLSSIKKSDFFSPVKQLNRANFALFCYLNNNDNYYLSSFIQEWGRQQISPKNVILMINNKPAVEYPHVKILSLYEINNYIMRGKDVFSGIQVDQLVNFLNR